MRPDQTVSANGGFSAAVDEADSQSTSESLRAECRRQEVVIDGLRDALSNLRRGAKALKGENSDLRGENDRLRDRADERELVQVAIALDVRAPGAARVAVAQHLHERVAVAALDNARLLVSELIANSLRHSDGPAGSQVIVSVELGSDWFRIGVQDSGSGAVITARTPDLETGGGFGLTLVQKLSERWGVERLAGGGTQVWAQLSRSGANRSQASTSRAA
jgi:anti-sigma regulatory factor (Ser/Thr protein kinase)